MDVLNLWYKWFVLPYVNLTKCACYTNYTCKAFPSSTINADVVNRLYIFIETLLSCRIKSLGPQLPPFWRTWSPTQPTLWLWCQYIMRWKADLFLRMEEQVSSLWRHTIVHLWINLATNWNVWLLFRTTQVLKFTYPGFSGPLGGVRNLQVTDPTSNTLNVRWEHADGNPRNYKVFYVPQPGDSEKMVRCDEVTSSCLYEGRSTLWPNLLFLWSGTSFRWHDKHRPT